MRRDPQGCCVSDTLGQATDIVQSREVGQGLGFALFSLGGAHGVGWQL